MTTIYVGLLQSPHCEGAERQPLARERPNLQLSRRGIALLRLRRQRRALPTTRFVTASASEAVSSAMVGDCVDLAKGGRGLAMTIDSVSSDKAAALTIYISRDLNGDYTGKQAC
jgi:hypothetical protein